MQVQVQTELESGKWIGKDETIYNWMIGSYVFGKSHSKPLKGQHMYCSTATTVNQVCLQDSQQQWHGTMVYESQSPMAGPANHLHFSPKDPQTSKLEFQSLLVSTTQLLKVISCNYFAYCS